MNDSLCGLTVLYNPDESIIDNIASYIDSLFHLYVIDNSEEPNFELKSLIELNSKVSYYCFDYNSGIAKALNKGCSMASKDGFSWILTMDQDSKFINGHFFDLLKPGMKPDIGIYAASFVNEYDRWVRDYNDDYNEIHFVITSGNMLNLKAWNLVGGFEEKLFIDEVDHDFCAKLWLNNFKVLTTKQIFLTHKIGIDIDIKNVVGTHAPFRHYYMTRNILFISKRYFLKDFTLTTNRLSVLFKSIARIIIYYPQKAKYLKYVGLGIWHFFQKKYGKLNADK